MKKRLLGLLSVFALVAGLFTSAFTEVVKAAEVTNYTLTTSLTKNGSPVTAATTVAPGENMSATLNLTFPDEQSISSGDVLTVPLPDKLGLSSTLTFNVLGSTGQVVGTATTSPAANNVTVTFTTDTYKEYSEKKGASLTFNVIANRTATSGITDPTVIGPFTWGGQTYSYTYTGTGNGEIDGLTYKYGYQSSSDPYVFSWKILVNGNQDVIRNIVIEDTFGEGHTLTGNIRLVQLELKEGGYKSEAEAAKASVVNNFSSQVTYTGSENGTALGATGFTFGPYANVFGGGSRPEYSRAFFIEYQTRLADPTKVKGSLDNTLKISGSNFPERVRTATATYDNSASGIVWGEKKTSAEIVAQKALTGEGANLADQQFEFGLYSVVNGKETLVETSIPKTLIFFS